MTVLISGAGIAGLTLALTCDQIGVPCRIVEQVSEIKPLGVGINLQPNAVRELFDLGLEAKLDAIGVRTEELAMIARNGVEVWREPRGKAAGYQWPQFSVHRGALQMMLYETVLERLGPDAIETGARGERFRTTGERAILETVKGPRDGAVLIAAWQAGLFEYVSLSAIIQHREALGQIRRWRRLRLCVQCRGPPRCAPFCKHGCHDLLFRVETTYSAEM